MATHNFPQQWLLAQFEQMKSRNSRTTLRSLALRLELEPGRLSEFLSGKRRITPKMALRIAGRLNLDPVERNTFVCAAESLHLRKPVDAYQNSPAADYQLLELDRFNVIADWYHFAILSLMELKDFEPSEARIASRLGISSLQAKSAIERLQRVGLIQIKAGRWVSTGKNLETPTDVASSALKRAHKQDLKRAIRALDDVPTHLRDITAITMPIDVRRLPEAKSLIREFRKNLAALLENGEKTDVYNLSIQLIPITQSSTRAK